MPTLSQFFIPCAIVLKENPTEKVRFESFPVDEGINEGYNADWPKSGGRASVPFMRRWIGGDFNPINLSLEFHAGMNPLELGSPPGVAIGRMINKVNWLKASAFPKPKKQIGKPGASTGLSMLGGLSAAASLVAQIQGQVAEPPRVLFVWGLFMILEGIITAWTVQWKGPYDIISGKPHGALVSLTFQPHSGTYPNWHDIKKGSIPGSFLGKAAQTIGNIV